MGCPSPSQFPGCTSNVTANWRNDLSSPLALSRAVPSLGGENVVGLLLDSLKPANTDEGLHRFGQGTLLGVYRWLVRKSLIAFILAHWAYLSTKRAELPDWGGCAYLALQTLLPEVVVSLLLLEVERTRPLLKAFGLELQLTEAPT